MECSSYEIIDPDQLVLMKKKFYYEYEEFIDPSQLIIRLNILSRGYPLSDPG